MIGAHDLANRATKLEAFARTRTPDWDQIQEHLDAIQEALKAIVPIAGVTPRDEN